MSDTWIEGKIRLEKAVGKDAADDILLEGYDKILVNIKEDGSIITEKLDDTGNIKNKKGGIEMLRDTLKDKEYFLEYIAEEEDRINKFETKLRNNEVREDRILNVRKKVYDLEFQILIAKYSMGEPIESLIDDYKLIAGKMEGFWDINLYEDML
ncbi:PoNe immunity protein domain-containing protein [Bacillus wiedmannii]|nr:PoNe immunity protein domain-containing protein [Bacillus wiedmannii]